MAAVNNTIVRRELEAHFDARLLAKKLASAAEGQLDMARSQAETIVTYMSQAYSVLPPDLLRLETDLQEDPYLDSTTVQAWQSHSPAESDRTAGPAFKRAVSGGIQTRPTPGKLCELSCMHMPC